ncbi:mitochondrial small ribosomal subunit Rsm22-domain-containing protein [Lanmaoa asiatica]|nr:mitochondrial small ribosomal subunit Rsm22-domain-containing protein [Lanmaoa asiatica]
MPKHKGTEEPTSISARELEALENNEGEIEYYDMDHEDFPIEEPARHREDRKSPAARFGSDGIGTVVLPPELQRSVTALIEGTNKTLLHSDAKRLFAEQDSSGENWSTAYNVGYKNRRQRYQHSARDGTAFASVILPAHYSAIYAVVRHVKHRLGALWNVDRVIDWGSATGSGLWATLNVFQKPSTTPGEGPLLANSTVVTYLGLDQREGLVSIAKQLLQKTELGALSAAWRKSFHEEYRVDPAKGHSTVALSAFMLSSQPSPLARKNMVKEMWDSGAQTIILIDYNSPTGFQNIAEARYLLLDLGRKETEAPEMMSQYFRGSHVVAPCPHDRPCPLQHSGPLGLVCGFSQRLQRPTFVRRTKHAKQGHEDIGYSYVVIRRGPRPDSTILGAKVRLVGRIGGVEREAIERAKAGTGVLRELQRAREHSHDRTKAEAKPESAPEELESPSNLENALRSEAYGWPRLVFPPLKKSGHIIIDACTREGKIMRLTIPKSQGKQAFYDARKSSWGDIFPHPSKNKPIERFQPTDEGTTSKQQSIQDAKGSDIGKRSKGRDKKNRTHERSYATLDDTLRREQKARWKASRKDLAFGNDEVLRLVDPEAGNV